MTRRLAHRGPDAEGFYSNENIALGHRRLSIIDLSESANQPMTDHTGRYVIVYNGEIYNYLEVRSLLQDYPFKTKSDSEVILAAFSTWGPDGLTRLNGMFAFAIWDTKQGGLFMARDRIGKKPLYYYLSGDFFVFGSEIRSLLASGLVPKNLDEDFLPEFLMYQATLDAHTLVEGVRQLKAGHYAIVKNGSIKEKKYWTYPAGKSNDNYGTIKSVVKNLFIDSVRLRMISDVPVGAFLSGGIDSSLVVACMAELSEQPVDTFTISFREKEFDESEFAQEIAVKYRTRHHLIRIRPDEFLDSLEEILSAMDSPSGDGPNTYLVAKHTKQAGIKVALSGLGGDELFAGYNKFLIYHKIMKNKWLTDIPPGLRRTVAKLIQTKNQKAANVLALEDWELSTVYPELRRSFGKHEAHALVRSSIKNNYAESGLKTIDDTLNGMENLSRGTIGELETYTRDVLLRDTDQMAMAHALEVRVPFFDYRLLEYVLSVPDKYKFPHTPKKLLVDALSPRLPDTIVYRKKMGFTFPMDSWLHNELASFVSEKIDYLADRKEFNPDAVQGIWKNFLKGDKQIKWPRIWQLAMLSDWLQRNHIQ